MNEINHHKSQPEIQISSTVSIIQHTKINNKSVLDHIINSNTYNRWEIFWGYTESIKMMITFLEFKNVFMFVLVTINFHQNGELVVMRELTSPDMKLIDEIMLANLIAPDLLNVGMWEPITTNSLLDKWFADLVVCSNYLISNFNNFVSHIYQNDFKEWKLKLDVNW